MENLHKIYIKKIEVLFLFTFYLDFYVPLRLGINYTNVEGGIEI